MGSKKPCPGCGRVDPERAANSVCHQCKCDLELSKAYKVELEQRKKKNTSDVERVSHGSRARGCRFPDKRPAAVTGN